MRPEVWRQKLAIHLVVANRYTSSETKREAVMQSTEHAYLRQDRRSRGLPQRGMDPLLQAGLSEDVMQ